MMTKGRAVIWGVAEVKPIVNVPPDALRVKLRLRNTTPAIAIVFFKDKIERWIIVPANGLLSCPEWKLGLLQGINQRIAHA